MVLVFDESRALDDLCRLIGQVAGEQQPVSGLDLIGEAHEQQRVAGESWGNESENTWIDLRPHKTRLLHKLRLCHLPKVILPLMISGLFFMSLMAAMGKPQLATGPQKCWNNTTHITTVLTLKSGYKEDPIIKLRAYRAEVKIPWEEQIHREQNKLKQGSLNQ